MKVSQLIKHLQSLDGDLKVFCYIEDEKFATAEAAFHLLDVTDVSKQAGILSRGSGGEPLVKWDNEHGRMLAIIGVTAQF